MDITTRWSKEQYQNYVTGNADPEQSMRNRISNDHGRNFEKLLSDGCEYYIRQGKAFITKLPEPYICLKKLAGGLFYGRFIGKAEPDFKGVLYGGRAIVFEAKSTQKPKLQQSALTDKQSRLLDKQQLLRAYAYVCINIRDRYFMVPWQYWKDMKRIYGRKYLMTSDIVQYEVKFDGKVRFLEYKNGLVIGGENV